MWLKNKFQFFRSPPIYGITINELAKQFEAHDSDKDGFINQEELGQILSTTAGITDQKIIEHVFKLADTQQRGLLSYDQFLELIRS
jgi:Ca2+-binding EF-hand superfamily protein